MLLALEERVRLAKKPAELTYLAVNEFRRLLGARQAYLLVRSATTGAFRIEAVSSIAAVERDAPLIRFIERVVDRLGADNGHDAPSNFNLLAYCDPGDPDAAVYPFRHFLWTPLLLRNGEAFAGLLWSRDKPFNDADRQIAGRACGTLAHGWLALDPRLERRAAPTWQRSVLLTGSVLALLALLIPVPMTTLAPFEIVPRDPFVITAPIDGVVEKVLVEPNATVAAGEEILRFEDTIFANRLALAEREIAVAAAEYRRNRQGAFLESEARYQLPIAKTTLALKTAERDYARDLLARTRLAAPVGGLVLYKGRSEIEGRPVSTGEAIMTIADPGRVSVRIELPVSDALVLDEGAPVRLFLDANPLDTRHARIERGAFHAEVQPSGVMAYEITAGLEPSAAAIPRIGARGTAQISGQTVSLGFFLFRRPIAFARQHLGL